MDFDRWGVPSNMSGAVDEDFFGLVGRIVLVAALLEKRLYVLYSQLDRGQRVFMSACGLEGDRPVEPAAEAVDHVRASPTQLTRSPPRVLSRVRASRCSSRNVGATQMTVPASVPAV